MLTKEAIFEQMHSSFQTTFGEDIDISITTEFGDINLTSLGLIQLVVEAEEKFDISIDNDNLKINKYHSVEDIIKMIQECMESQQ